MSADANIAYSLSEETGLGAELCKLALERSKNDIDSTRSLLKRWGTSKVNTNSLKTFGLACTYFEREHAAASLVKVTCTDELFSKSREFYELVGGIAAEVVAYEEAYVAQSTIEDLQKAHNCKININSARFLKTGEFSLLTTYTHRDSIGVILETEVDNSDAFTNKQFRSFSLDCALHIAAFDPISIDKTDIPQHLRHEVELQIEKQLAREGREMKYWPIAVEGRINKWIEQRTLINQIFIKNEKTSTNDIRKKISEKIGSEIIIKRFARFAVGS